MSKLNLNCDYLYLCTMKTIGLLGDITKLDSLINKIKTIDKVLILGKVSDGISSKLDQIHFTIPEKNKFLLLEACDIFIIENPNLFSFDETIQSIKKGKSIYFLNYPNYTIEQCQQIIKLSDEAQSTVHLNNSYSDLSSIRKVKKDFSTPFYIDLNYSNENFVLDKESILSFLLLVISLNGIPKRIEGTIFSDKEVIEFFNIKFGYNNSSSIDLKLNNVSSVKFDFELYNKHGYKRTNIRKELMKANNEYGELLNFLKNVEEEKTNNQSIESYISALRLIEKINEKFSISL